MPSNQTNSPQSLKVMLKHISQHARVLDLGCGDGTLLVSLKEKKNIKGYGIDINFKNILSCIKHGISVYQGDLDEGLSGIPNQSFDVVILSLTLQEILKPAFLISEIMRVGKIGIITFPNFGHWSLRYQLLVTGKTPVTKNLPFYWHNTPNLRMLTYQDFIDLCDDLTIKIIHNQALNTSIVGRILATLSPNLFAENGMFVIMKEDHCKTSSKKEK